MKSSKLKPRKKSSGRGRAGKIVDCNPDEQKQKKFDHLLAAGYGNQPLLFVPTSLTGKMERNKIKTVSKLWKLDLARLPEKEGWGPVKVLLVVALQDLYRQFYDCVEIENCSVSSIVPPQFVTPSRLLEMTARELVLLNPHDLGLSGRHKLNFLGLQRLFASRIKLSEQDEASMLFLSDFDQPETNWKDVPIPVSKRITDLFEKYGLTTLSQIDEFARTEKLYLRSSGKTIDAGSLNNLGPASLDSLRILLMELNRLGLEGYCYGSSGKPTTAVDFARLVSEKLNERDALIFQLRSDDQTLEKIGLKTGLTKERARQINVLILHRLHWLRDLARDIIRPVTGLLEKVNEVPVKKCLKLTGAEKLWQFRMAARIAGQDFHELDSRLVFFASVPLDQIQELDEYVRDLLWQGTLVSDNARQLRKHLKSMFANRHELQSCDLPQLIVHVNQLIGTWWFRQHIQSQLITAGINGLFFDQIDTGDVVESSEKLAAILGKEADVLRDGRFRRPGKGYRRADEVVRVLKKAKKPLALAEIIKASKLRWHPRVLKNNYISPLLEIVAAARGRFVHIDRLQISIRDVQEISAWGENKLSKTRKMVPGKQLFYAYARKKNGFPLENVYQLISILTKHPDVQRIACSTNLIHRSQLRR